MLRDNFAFICNYLWRESIRNLNNQLTETEAKRFSSNDYYYLTTIYYLQRPNFSQVAEALGLTKPAVSAIIGKLAGMGLIKKEQSEKDRRIYHISLTEKGKRIMEGDQALYEGFASIIKKNVSNAEQYAFIEALLDKIVLGLKEAVDYAGLEDATHGRRI